jgi:hypothetical protein
MMALNTFESWQYVQMLTKARSASSIMKVLVSREAFLRRILTKFSKYGSRHRFKKMIMSFIVMSAIFDREDLIDSTSFRS